MNISKLKGNPLYFNVKMLDLEPVTLTITGVEVRKINADDRVVLMFDGEERDMKLTARQVATLARAFGDDTDEWKGKAITAKRGDKGIDLTAESSAAKK